MKINFHRSKTQMMLNPAGANPNPWYLIRDGIRARCMSYPRQGRDKPPQEWTRIFIQKLMITLVGESHILQPWRGKVEP